VRVVSLKSSEALKHALALRFALDREAYTDAKTEFVRTMLAKALGT
jgi:GrpB-like predicted nucleotidyltransferase (UPF0157 family)